MPVSNLPMDNITGVPYNDWPLGAGATKMAAMNTDDADTGYLGADGTNNHRQCFNVTWPTDVADVNSIKNYCKMRQGSALQYHIAIGVRNAGGESENDPAPSGLPTTYTGYTTSALSRPGGGSWTSSDCANGVTYWQARGISPGSGNGRMTHGYIVLDYTPAGAGFVNIWSVVLPLLGVGIGLAHMRGIARECRRLGGVWPRPDEFEAMLRGYREYRHPRIFIPRNPSVVRPGFVLATLPTQ